MINIDNLTDEDVGREVIYTDGVGHRERGRLKSWNDTFIFVVYNCAGDWNNFQVYSAAATNSDDLRFSSPEVGEDDGSEDIKTRFEILDLREENE